MARPHEERSTTALFGLGVLGVLFGLGALVVLESAPAPPEPLAATPPAPRADATLASLQVRPAEPVHVPAPLDIADDGVPIKPHDPRDPEPEGPMHPHPVTPKHLRIYHENNLLGQLDGAIDVEDAAGLRRLLEQYRSEYPENEHSLQQGYQVILDCFEHPGAESRAGAELYYDTQNVLDAQALRATPLPRPVFVEGCRTPSAARESARAVTPLRPASRLLLRPRDWAAQDWSRRELPRERRPRAARLLRAAAVHRVAAAHWERGALRRESLA